MPDTAFWQARLEKCKTQIVLYEDAIDALVVQGVSSYILDTGQTRQHVTKQDLASLQRVLDGLLNRCATLEARISGAGTAIMRPGW